MCKTSHHRDAVRSRPRATHREGTVASCDALRPGGAQRSATIVSGLIGRALHERWSVGERQEVGSGILPNRRIRRRSNLHAAALRQQREDGDVARERRRSASLAWSQTRAVVRRAGQRVLVGPVVSGVSRGHPFRRMRGNTHLHREDVFRFRVRQKRMHLHPSEATGRSKHECGAGRAQLEHPAVCHPSQITDQGSTLLGVRSIRGWFRPRQRGNLRSPV